MTHLTHGMVYIVGAGPGDPGLITVKGLACIRRAEVLLYDRLVHPLLLDEAPATAELIDVGKAPEKHRRSQAEINDLLVAHGRAGRIVVRLKGGDPFVFGRGAEECQALAEAGLAYEVVPGISSAVAVPAYAGIPVTHRDFANTFTVLTGHSAGPAAVGVDWATLPKRGTLVCLMGVKHLPAITAQLMAHGHAPETPAAVIGWGTTAAQTVVEGSLADIAQRAAHVPAPAAVVIGEVVRLRRQLDWFNPSQVDYSPWAEADTAALGAAFAAAFVAREVS